MSELNPDNAKLEELISERFTVNNYLVKKDFHEKLLLRDENGNRIRSFFLCLHSFIIRMNSLRFFR